MNEQIKKRFEGLCCIEFSGEDCGACLSLMPVLQDVISERPALRLEHVEVNAESKETVQFFGVDRVPTMLLCVDGEEFARCHGFQPQEILELWIDAKVEEHEKKK